MSKHKLTEEQEENIKKYYELIKSEDEESVLLGIQLFYNDFKDFKCPHRKHQEDKIIFTDFFRLKEPNPALDWFYRLKIYWLERIVDLGFCGYYYD